MLQTLHRQHVPSLSMMLADLGDPNQMQVARALGVSMRTVSRWVARDQAPRPVMLALFWLTQWGRSAINAEAVRDVQQQAQFAACYRAMFEDAQAKLDHLGRIGDFGAANDPTPEVRRRPLALPMLAVLGDPQPAPGPKAAAKKRRKKTASQKRAERSKRRLAKRADEAPKPFDFLRAG